MKNDQEAGNIFLQKLREVSQEREEPQLEIDRVTRVTINRPVRCTIFIGDPAQWLDKKKTDVGRR